MYVYMRKYNIIMRYFVIVETTTSMLVSGDTLFSYDRYLYYDIF